MIAVVNSESGKLLLQRYLKLQDQWYWRDHHSYIAENIKKCCLDMPGLL